MTTRYFLRLQNDTCDAWHFYVYQTPLAAHQNIASLVWIGVPQAVAPDAHATLMWSDAMQFIWCSPARPAAGMRLVASGAAAVDPNAIDGVLFNQDHNTPGLSPRTGGQHSGVLSVATAANVLSDTYSVGISVDGSHCMIAPAGIGLSSNFAGRYWIGASRSAVLGSVLDLTQPWPALQVAAPLFAERQQYRLAGADAVLPAWRAVAGPAP